MEINNYFFTGKQVAQLLGVTRQTVYSWVKREVFSAQHVGREVLIPKWEVELIKEKRAK